MGHVEQAVGIQFAHRAAVGALHIVGEDFKLRLGIGRGGPVKQHRADRLRAIGPVGTLGDANLAEVIGRGLPASDRAHDLTADRIGLGMQHVGDDLDGLSPAGQLRRAEREAGAPPQLDPHRDPAIA